LVKLKENESIDEEKKAKLKLEQNKQEEAFQTEIHMVRLAYCLT
jgi:hypothetical protein